MEKKFKTCHIGCVLGSRYFWLGNMVFLNEMQEMLETYTFSYIRNTGKMCLTKSSLKVLQLVVFWAAGMVELGNTC